VQTLLLEYHTRCIFTFSLLLFDPFFGFGGGGGGTVTAGSLFAAADEDATEDFFVMSRPVSFLSPLFVGIVLLGVCFLDGTLLLGKISVGQIARCDILWV
jgi:hypothetical protein